MQVKFCRDCGRKVARHVRRCMACYNKSQLAKYQATAAPIKNPTDAEMEMIFDGLISQRSRALLSDNRCLTEEAAEERALRARMGV